MRIPVLPFVITLFVCVVADVYIYIIAKRRCRTSVPSRMQLITSLLMYAGLIVGVALPRRSGSDGTLLSVMWILFSFSTVYLPKILFVVIDLIACIPKLFHKRRLGWLSLSGGVLALVLFISMWWGALVNRYRVQVVEIDVPIENLPQGFDGYRIVQFSDLHTGTFGTDTTFVSHLADKLNSLNGDVIVFTGDIVNRRTDELEPQWRPLARLDAPDGVYAILGNHDYGDYSEWKNAAWKQDNMNALYDYFNLMGWRLLLNEHEMLRHGNDSIALVGVENVGDPPFTVYGSLPDSYPDLADGVVKVLLSHNPAHWVTDIADNDSVNVALTLSGHTHAMQIEVCGLSPAAGRYPTWGGLYTDKSNSHKLYVNIGAGTVGFPMRLGATPEITVLTLRRAD